MKLFKHRLIFKLVVSVIITTFLWSNLIYASGSLTTNYLAVDGGKVLNGVFTEFRVLSTPLAIHNGVTAKGIESLRGLADELENIKRRLVRAGVIPQEEADKYLAMRFDDSSTDVSAYYYFNMDGYFLRITPVEKDVNDKFYTDFLRLRGRRDGDIVSINGNSLEKFLVSKDDIKGINICLKRLYGYTLYDALRSTEEAEKFESKQNPVPSLAGNVKDKYEKLIGQKQSTELSVVYDYAHGKGKAYRLRVPKEKDLTNDEKAFVVAYLAVYIYNRLTTVGAKNLRLITEDKDSIIGILEEIKSIFMHGKSIYSTQYPMLNQLWLMTVGSKIINGEERGLRMKTFYEDFGVSIEQKAYEGPAEEVYDPERANLLKQLEGVKGTYIGLDVGGSNMKVVVVKDGKLIYTKKYTWDPKKLKPAWRHIKPVKAMIELAALAAVADRMGVNIYNELVNVSSDIVKLEIIEDTIARIRSKLGLRGRKIVYKKYIDGIGISWPDIIREQEVVGGRTGKVKHLKRTDFERIIKPLAGKIEELFGPRTFLINDGDVGAFVAGVKLGIGNIVSIAMGTSTGIGYLSSNGEIIDYITDMSHVIMYFNETDPETAHETTGIKGAMQKYLSQKGMFRLAKEKGIDLSGIKGDTEKLKEFQRLYEQKDKMAIEIVDEMAVYLADGIQQLMEGYFSDRPISIFVLSGRTVEGKAGEKIVARAKEILAERNIKVELKMADELDPNWDDRMRDLAQAVGAAYFAAMKMESYYRVILGEWRNEHTIDKGLYDDAILIMEDKRYSRGAADEIMELVKRRDIGTLERLVKLKEWLKGGVINEELYKDIISLIGDRQYGNFVADKVVELVKQGNIDKLKAFVTQVIDKRKNIDKIKALMDPKKTYEGYDVIIITSSTQAEADLQEEVLRRIFKGSGRDVKILSVVEEWAEGGAGNFLGTLNAYLEAREQARELYNINLDEYWETGKKICVIHNGGMGKRDNPFTVSYDNSRGTQKMIGYIKLQDGTRVPITLLTLTILSNCINAISNNGDQIDVYWSSQIIIGNKSVEDVYEDDKGYLFSTYGMILPVDREVTESDLRQFSVWEANEDAEAIAFHKAKTFSTVSQWGTWRIEKARQGQVIFRDIGSHRFSKKLFFYLMNYFDDMLKRREGKIDLSYDLIQPLMVIIEGFQEVDLARINSVDDVETKLKESGRFSDLKRLCTVSPEYYKNIIEIFFANKDEIDSIAKWIKIVDLGDNPYWWTYRTPIDKLNCDLAMIADLVGKKSFIDNNGQIQEEDLSEGDIIMAEDMRRIRGLEYPIEDLEINGRRYSFTLEQVKRGIEVEGVFIRGSVVRNCILFPGSRIVDSILEDVIGEVNAENSELVSVVSPRIDVKRSIIHNLILADDLIANGRSIAGVYRPEIRDDRYPDGMTVINVPIDLDVSADRNFYNIIEDGDNRFSLSDLYRFKCDRTENEDLRKGIKIKVFKLMAKKAAAEFRRLHANLGEDILPDVTKNIALTDDQIKARKCIEILARIAMMDYPPIANTANRPLYVDIVMYLNDFLTVKERNICLKGVYQRTDLVRKYPSLNDFDRKMSEFGINTEREHLEYHNRVRQGIFKDEPSKRNEVKKIVVLPRITIGAEIAITSVLIKRLLEIYPKAEIVFIVGDKKVTQLFEGNPRLQFVILEKTRIGGLVANLKSWVRLVNKIQEIKPDFVFAADSRTDAQGAFPVIKPERYFFWENTLLSDQKPKPMAMFLNDKMDGVFGKRKDGPVIPTVYLGDRFIKFAKTLKRNCNLEGRYVVTVNYNVGGEYDKALGHDFEWEYLKELLEERNVVIMDRGFGDEEIERSQMLIDKAREMGVRIIEVTDLPDGRGNQVDKVNLEPDYKGGVLIVFHGTIGGWISMSTIADEAFSYDSMAQHAATADKDVAGQVPVAGTPAIVVFTGYHSDIFPELWRPIGRSSIDVIKTGVGKCSNWHPVAEMVKKTHENLRLRNSLPLELSGLRWDEYNLSDWPTMEPVDGLSLHTQILISLSSLVSVLTGGEYQRELSFMYGLAYIRQLNEAVRERVLKELTGLGYNELAEWLKQNMDKVLEEQVREIIARLKSTVDPDEFMKLVRLRDRAVTYSRSLRMAAELADIDLSILRDMVEKEEILWVIFGLREAVIIDRIDESLIKHIEELLWTFKQVEDVKINVLELPDGRFYIYDEYGLKNRALADRKNIAVTRQGLEHLIKIDMVKGSGLLYKVAVCPAPSDLEKNLIHKVAKGILIGQIGRRFSVWDNKQKMYRGTEFAKQVFELEKAPLNTVFIGTYNRPIALKNQIEVELENYKIFNCSISVVVMDFSTPDILNHNKKTLNNLKQNYGVNIIHLVRDDFRKYVTDIVDRLIQRYQKALKDGDLDPRILKLLEDNNILVDGNLDKDKMLKYFFSNPFRDISGLRNYTVLLGKEDRVIMNIDDDAPPETYVLHREERERIRKERRLKCEKLIIQMLSEASQILGIQVNSEAEFYRVMGNPSDYAKLADLERKYLGYSPDENVGKIPQSMGEIQELSSQFLKDKYGLGHELSLTHQRYQSLMEPLSHYMVTVSDFEYLPQRYEKDSGRFKVLPVNTIRAARLVGKKVRDINLPVMKSDLRGTMAVPVVKEGRDEMQDKFIFYVPYPFILDQDTSALAQFIRYLEMEDKVRENLQHTDQSAIIAEGVGGFVGDTYVIFNRAALLTTLPTPSIGRDLRLEEPPYVVWVAAPVFEGKATVAYSPVAGGQQRVIDERQYVISYQDYNELVGGTARRFYEEAVGRFYKLLETTPELQGEGNEHLRMRALGAEYIKMAEEFSLSEEQKNKLIKEREIRAMLCAELGIQRSEKYIEASQEQDSERRTNLEQQIRDMDLIITQYGDDFCLYNTTDRKGDNYSPKDVKKDYFYKIEVKGNKLIWEAVYPELKIDRIGGVKYACDSSWHTLEDKGGEIDLSDWQSGDRIQIESGRYIILKRLPGQGVEAIVPAVVEDFRDEFLKQVEKKASDQIKSDGETLILWPDILEFARSWRELGYCVGRVDKSVHKKLPATIEVSYSDWIYIRDLVNKARMERKIKIKPIAKDVKDYFIERAPPTWRSSDFANFYYLIENNKIMFQIDDLGDLELYPKLNKDDEGLLSFIELLFRKEEEVVTEEVYEGLSKDEKEKYKGFYVIHLTKRSCENIEDDIYSKHLLAQLIVHELVEYFLPPPKGISRHRYACQYEGYFNKEAKAGISDLNRYMLRRAGEKGNYKYLFKILGNYNPRRDQDGTFLEALYEAIDKLPQELRDGSNISTGGDFTVWYRYMFDHVYKKSDDAVYKITNLIDEKKEQNKELKKIVEDSYCRWVVKYMHNKLRDKGIGHVYIPQCHVELPKDGFISLDIEYKGDVKKKAQEILECIKNLLDRDVSQVGIEGELNDIRLTTGGEIKLYEVLLMKAEEDGKTIKDLLKRLSDEYKSSPDKALSEIGGILYNLPVVEFMAREIERQWLNLNRCIGVGVIGSGAAGKTTFSAMLKQWLRKMGMKKADTYGSDIELHPGDEFRYVKTRTGGRTSYISGPGIYNDSRLLKKIRHIKNGGKILVGQDIHGGKPERIIGPDVEAIIIEGVNVGLDRSIAHEMDIKIAIIPNEKSRVQIKLDRDLGEREGYEDIDYVIKDTVYKLFYEKTDVVKRVALGRADYVFVEELDGRRTLYIKSNLPPRPPTEEGLITGYMDRVRPLLLKCPVQKYACGDELWMGAHPNAPAMVNITDPMVDGIAIGLDILVRHASDKILGEDVVGHFGNELPYLFKILTASKPLSIQVHPNKEQAVEGFKREEEKGIKINANNRNYKDQNYKPKLICALKDFYALKGFRPLEEIAKVLDEVPEFGNIIPDFSQRLQSCVLDINAKKDLLKDLYTRIMDMSQKEVDSILQPLIKRLKDIKSKEGYSKDTREYWVLRADEEFCNEKHGEYRDEVGYKEHKDIGIFSIYLLNLIHLKPDEALYLQPCELHAYLGGDGLEITANSDNVICGGLAPEHVDASELFKILDFSSGKPDILEARQIPSGKNVYHTPVPEFKLSVFELDENKRYESSVKHSADIILVTSGKVKINIKDIDYGPYEIGQVVLLPAAVGKYIITTEGGSAKVYKASPGIGVLEDHIVSTVLKDVKHKKMPGTEDISYEQWCYFLRLSEEGREKEGSRSRDENIPDEVKEFLKDEAPKNLKLGEWVDFKWLLDNNKIKFYIDDLGDKEFYPRFEGDLLGTFSFSEKTEKEKAIKIHLTHVTYEMIKDNKYILTQLIMHKFYEQCLGESHSGACAIERLYMKPNALRGVSDLTKYLLDCAARRNNYEYLFGLIKQYDVRKDRDRVFITSMYEAIDKLPVNIREGYRIKTGDDFTAWYRYMFEHCLKRSDNAVCELTRKIDEVKDKNSDLKEIIDGSGERWVLKYDGGDIVKPEVKAQFDKLLKDNDISYIYIPQCPVELDKKKYVILDVEYQKNVEEQALNILYNIEECIEKSMSLEEIKSKVGVDRFTTDFFEVLENIAEEEHIDKIVLLKYLIEFKTSSIYEMIGFLAGLLDEEEIMKNLGKIIRVIKSGINQNMDEDSIQKSLNKIGTGFYGILRKKAEEKGKDLIEYFREFSGYENQAEEILSSIRKWLKENRDERVLSGSIGGGVYGMLEKRTAGNLKGYLQDLAVFNGYSDVIGIFYNISVAKFLTEISMKFYKDYGEKPIAIGIIGSGGAGKSSLATLLAQEIRWAKHIKANEFGADTELFPGSGFRYEVTSTKGRNVYIFGQGIYDNKELIRKLRHIKNGGVAKVKAETYAGRKEKEIGPYNKITILEGVYVGLDPDTAKEFDIQVALIVNERNRVVRKLGRDLGVRKGYENVLFAIRDTVDKLFHEKTDAIKRVAIENADFLFVEELDGKSGLYIRSKTPQVTERDLLASFIENPIVTELRCPVQTYDWGDTNFIQELIEKPEYKGKSWAELWIGAHSKDPATIHISNPWIPEIRIGLNRLIRHASEKILGRDVENILGVGLPYLFKVLAAAKPLSIQVHPNKKQAVEGFKKEEEGIKINANNRNYKDQNHKPELICALKDFYALKGFKPLEEIAKVLNDVPEFKDIMPNFSHRLDMCGLEDRKREDLLRELYRKIMVNAPDPNKDSESEMLQKQGWVDNILRGLIKRLKEELPESAFSINPEEKDKIANWGIVESMFPKDTPECWVLRADVEFCNKNHCIYKWYKKKKPGELQNHTDHKDIGIISIYLLNLIHLKLGEALYLQPCELHAYLEGVGLEVMANSDNVIRGGLTPKHVDVPELLNILKFRSGRPEVLKPILCLGNCELAYHTPASEFILSIIDLNKDNPEYTSPSNHSADAIIVLDGEVEVISGVYKGVFKKGQTIFIPRAVGKYEIKVNGEKAKLYKTTPNINISQEQPKQGPVEKNATGTYSELWEAESKDGVLSEGIPIGIGKGHPGYNKINISLLKDTFNKLVSVYGPGILAIVDAIRVVDNIGIEELKGGIEDIVLYGMMIEEGNRNILLLDVDAFNNERLLYTVLEHELKESIMTVVPCESDAVREITTNYMSLKLALEEGIRFDKDQLARLGADLQFYEALEVLQAMVSAGEEINDVDIIAVALEHMRSMPYYKELFQQFEFAVEWEKKLKEAENGYRAAIEIFNDIMEARLGIDKVNEERLQNELKKAREEIEINIRVINTFTGRIRVVGLEKLSRRLQHMIGAMVKMVYSASRFAKQVRKSSDKKYILVDNDRLKEWKEIIGEDEYEKLVKTLRDNNYEVCVQIPGGVELKDVIRLVDPCDLDKMQKVEGMLYLPIPYTRSSFYIAASVLYSGGEVDRLDGLIKIIIMSLYNEILGKQVTDEDLEILINKPWIFLPRIQSVLSDLNKLRTAVVQIEKAA